MSESNEDVASSNKIIWLFFNIALAIEILCFSPPDKRMPFSPIIVSYFKGSSLINSSQYESFAASLISFSDASTFA